MEWTKTVALEKHIELQRKYVAKTAPACDRLLTAFQSLLRTPFRERLDRTWRHRIFHAWYERTALLMATLRWSALTGGSEHPLYEGLVDPVAPNAVTLSRVSSALLDETVWDALALRTVQTNETSRAVVWRLPAALISEIQPTARFSLFDLGASAGLNLVGDRLNAPWTDQDGRPVLKTGREFDIVQRIGFDRTPLDANREDDVRWLYACTWPGRPERLQRLTLAVAAFRECVPPPKIIRCSASEAPSQMNDAGDFSLAYQSLLHDYLPPAEKQTYEAGMHAWLRLRPGQNWWIELEISNNAPLPETAASITARCFDGEEVCSYDLARCHPHPDRLFLNRGQLEAFSHAVRRALGSDRAREFHREPAR